jgi:hypothetical protein
MVTVPGQNKGFSGFKQVKESWRFVLGCLVLFGGALYLWLR